MTLKSTVHSSKQQFKHSALSCTNGPLAYMHWWNACPAGHVVVVPDVVVVIVTVVDVPLEVVLVWLVVVVVKLVVVLVMLEVVEDAVVVLVTVGAGV